MTQAPLLMMVPRPVQQPHFIYCPTCSVRLPDPDRTRLYARLREHIEQAHPEHLMPKGAA